MHLVRRLLIGACLPLTALAQSARAPLDDLVAVALRQNLGLRQQEVGVARADAALREARGLYLPSATVNARYTQLAGNTVNIGQLINPAFSALNQLLQQPAFPTNLDIQLPLRQETTIRVAQPLFQPSIRAANRAAGAMADVQAARRDAAAHDLAADVRAGYLTWARLHFIVGVFDSSLTLLDEHVRVAERLVTGGVGTPDLVLRARAERSDVLQRRDEAALGRDAARAALNTLLARPLDTPLALFPEEALAPGDLPDRDLLLRRARDGRQELRQLDHARRATQARESLARGTFLPTLALAVDYGVQGKEYRFDRSRDFTALTLVASWNVFNGGQDAARLEQAQLEGRQLALQHDDVARQVDLQVSTAWDAARVAQGAITTAGDRLAAARRAFDLTRRRHEQGTATQLEFLDARVALTTAQLNAVVTRYDYYLRRVALDRAAATDDLPALAARDTTPAAPTR